MTPVEGRVTSAAGAPLADLYRAEWNRVFAVCFALLRSPEDAEDATQETFARIVARAGTLAGDPTGYLVTTARNVCIDELRRRSRWQQSDSDVDLQRSGGQTIEDSAVTRDVARLAWQRLGDADRRVVAYLFAGLSPTEIGARLGWTAGLVSVRLFRARQRLRRLTLAPALLASVGNPRLMLQSLVRRLHGLRSEATTTLLARMQDMGGGAMPVLMSVLVSGLGGVVAQPTGDVAVAVQTTFAAPTDRLLGDVSASLRHALAEATQAAGARAAPTPTAMRMSLPTFYPSPHYEQDHTLMATEPNGDVYRTNNGGRTWKQVGSGFAGELMMPPTFPASPTLYALRSDGLARSDDGGRTFAVITAVLHAVKSSKEQVGGQVNQVAGSLPGPLATPLGTTGGVVADSGDGQPVTGDAAAIDPASLAGSTDVFVLDRTTAAMSVYDSGSGSVTPFEVATDQADVRDVFTAPGATGVYVVAATATHGWSVYLCSVTTACSRLGPASRELRDTGLTRVASPTSGTDRVFWYPSWDQLHQVTLGGDDIALPLPPGWTILAVLPEAHHASTRVLDAVAVSQQPPYAYRMFTWAGGGFRMTGAPPVPTTISVFDLVRLGDGSIVGMGWDAGLGDTAFVCSPDNGVNWRTHC